MDATRAAKMGDRTNYGHCLVEGDGVEEQGAIHIYRVHRPLLRQAAGTEPETILKRVIPVQALST